MNFQSSRQDMWQNASRVALLIACLFSSSVAAQKSVAANPTSATSARAAVSSDELVALLRNAKIVDPSYKLTITISSEEILVTTQRKPKSSDADTKIQAVLIGKTAFDATPNGPQRTKVLFFDYEAGNYVEVSVKRAEVKLFGSGQLSQADLLSSLELRSSKPVGAETVNNLAPGPMQPERLMTYERINRLKKRGTNVSGYMGLFDAVEQSAKASNAERVKTGLTDLNRRLQEQEATIQRLQEASRGPHTNVNLQAGLQSEVFAMVMATKLKLEKIARAGFSVDQFSKPFSDISTDIEKEKLSDAKTKVVRLNADLDSLITQLQAQGKIPKD